MRIVITGIGIISPLGHDPAVVLDHIRAGRSGIRRVRAFDTTHFSSPFAGEIQDFRVEDYLSAEEMSSWNDRYLWFAIAALRNALKDASLPDDFEGDPRVAVVAGTCNGGLKTAERLYRYLHGRENGSLDAKMNILFRYYALGRALASVFHTGGPVRIITTACSSSTGALGIAMDIITLGRANVVLAGGTDALCLTAYSGFSGIKAMCRGVCAPFSGDGAYGLNLGEGAAFWVLESESHARTRGARILGVLDSYALTSDAYHPTAPDPRGDGAYRAMKEALIRAGRKPDDIAYINAHGTGTESNDLAESKAIERLFRRPDGSVPVLVSSTKSFIGHCLGAAGVLEATVALLAMLESLIPPTLNMTVPRPGCRLNYVPNRAVRKEYTCFLSDSMAFGGHNAAIVVSHPEAPSPPRSVTVSTKRRIAVTGVGAVTAFGPGAKKFRYAIREGVCGIRRVERFDTSGCKAHHAGLVPDVDWRRVHRRLKLDTLWPISRYAVWAAAEAMQSAGVRPRPGGENGLVFGVCVGPSEESLMDRVWSSPVYEPDLTNFAMIVANSTAGIVARELYLKGYNTVLSSGYQAGLAAMIQAEDALRSGFRERLIVVASDEIFPRYFYNYDAVDLLPGDDAVRRLGIVPLEGDRRVLGEGAAAVLLEPMASAKARHAGVLGVLLGSGEGFDPGDVAEGTGSFDGLVHAMEMALSRAGTNREEIELILTAYQGNRGDRRETDAYDRVFKTVPPVVNTSFATGYLESGSALLSLIAALCDPGERPFDVPAGPGPHHVMCIGTSRMGYSYALVLEIP